MYERRGGAAGGGGGGREIEASLKERFQKFDEIAEYNQLKVINAMQDNRVSAGSFN